jgi:cysteinyl-tRNA synthetase
MPNLRFYNTLTRLEEPFTPIDSDHVRVYVCGPTVYDRAHIGNARSAVVYDVMVRLLRHLFPKVTYVRNITDVDDKINKAARERGVPIGEITTEMTRWYHEDTGALNVALPDVEPRATEHIGEMIAMIEALIAKGYAYAAEGHVLFAVESDEYYGCLSRRTKEHMVAGARVEVAPYKRYAGDFVLWKPSKRGQQAAPALSERSDAHASDSMSRSGAIEYDEPGWQSPWGFGRPGWHIECSAMSTKYLGHTFDIHGGGADLIFPHHENEIAQSTCAHDDSEYARCWVHNGFLTVDGNKMSKSDGNFITVHDLLSRGVKGEVIRYALMSTHYRKPLDWSDKLLEDAQKTMDGFYRQIDGAEAGEAPAEFLDALRDDLNVPKATAMLHGAAPAQLKAMGQLIGLFGQDAKAWFKGEASDVEGADDWIDTKIAERIAAKKARDFAASDRIRDELKADGIILEDRPDGTTDWRRA